MCLRFRYGAWYVRFWRGGKLVERSTGTSDRRKAEIVERQVLAERDQRKLATRMGLVPPEPDFQRKFALETFAADYHEHFLLIGGRDLRADRERAWGKESAPIRGFIAFAKTRGVMRLDRVTPALMEDYKKRRAQDPGRGGRRLSDHTVNHTLRVLKAFFYFAKHMGYVKENPVCAVKPVKTATYEIPFLAETAAAEILRRALEHPLHPLLATALYAGLRHAELASLEWPDVGFAEGFIRVRNKETARTKSRKPRLVPLARALRRILEPLHAARLDEQRKRRNRSALADGLCFPNDDGKIYRGVTLTHRVNRLGEAMDAARAEEAKKAGRKPPKAVKWTLQTLRRTFATLLRMKGVELGKISKWLGHSSVRVTEAWYADLPFDGGDDAIHVLDFGAVAEGETEGEAPTERAKADRKPL